MILPQRITAILRRAFAILHPCVYGELGSKDAAANVARDLEREIALLMPDADAGAIAAEFAGRIGEIRRLVETDIDAAYDGDPATTSRMEVVMAYPGLYAVTVHRIAHELYVENVAMIPRIMTEYAHSQTGIDINPGATIGEYFFIDHGTGIVVGETSVIGERVKLYQGTTLGAMSPAGMAAIPGERRHPKVGNNVTIYANATLLGGATEVGDNVVIGSNVFLTESVESDMKVGIKKPEVHIRGKRK
jgi:serine O-acetyltransferase